MLFDMYDDNGWQKMYYFFFKRLLHILEFNKTNYFQNLTALIHIFLHLKYNICN